MLKKFSINAIIYVLIHLKMKVKLHVNFFEFVITSKIHKGLEIEIPVLTSILLIR